MALSKEVYKEFEDVVGAENISNDPVMVASYRLNNMVTIVLPANTEEVQAVVRLCNKFKLPFRVGSTGWTVLPVVSEMIYLDMKRMNRIIEINEENMYAVVEPYVIAAQLQAELMKRSLNCNMKGAGANCSALSMSGHGHMGLTTSTGDRNVLATEWVTDEGDIISLGSLGSADSWFCGDGPGPSLRGILQTGGIITKQALKAYHWPGPSRFPIVGPSPRYTLSEIPPNMFARYYSFPSIEKWLEAELKIGKAEIAFLMMGFNAYMLSSNVATCKEEEMKIYKQIKPLVQGPGFVLIIAGNYPEDFEYKKQVAQLIISETGGKSLELSEDPEIAGILLSSCIRISASIRETSRAGGGPRVVAGNTNQGQRYDLAVRWLEDCAEEWRKLIKKGLAVDDGGVQFGWGDEQGHLGHSELFCKFDGTNPASEKEAVVFRKHMFDSALNKYCILPGMGAVIDELGPFASNYHIWEGKVKQAFDPNGVGEFTGFFWMAWPPTWISYPARKKSSSESSPKKVQFMMVG